MFTHEEFMAWLTVAVRTGADLSDDKFQVTRAGVDGDVLELDIEYWTDDNQTDTPTDTAKLRLRIE